MLGENIKSILIGNGLDIQVGGDDYLNKWIVVRLLANANSGKYDPLFMNRKDADPIATGDEIIAMLNGMVDIANRARKNEYDLLVESYKDANVMIALKDFQSRYSREIFSVEEIGMEDWVLLLLIFLINEGDILEEYEAAKRGFERMVFDSIYCDGGIQYLYSKVGKAAKFYFCQFDNIFTLNYDNTLEKITNLPVYHLHGDFLTKSPAENPNNTFGYLRNLTGQNTWFPSELEQCYCNAILDYSGGRKYKTACRLTGVYTEIEKIRETVDEDDCIEDLLKGFPDRLREIIQISIENKLACGHNYHFQDLEQLTGTLTLLGVAPQNDSHIFTSINKSNVEKVVFYHYFGDKNDDEVNAEIKNMKLEIDKPFEIKNIKNLWNKIKLVKPNNSITYRQVLANQKPKQKDMDILSFLNSIYPEAHVSIGDIIGQLKTIPVNTEKTVFKMMEAEMSNSKYHTAPSSRVEIGKLFRNFGKTLEIASISPQALFCLYFVNMETKKRRIRDIQKKSNGRGNC
jgi:hypothetical protein